MRRVALLALLWAAPAAAQEGPVFDARLPEALPDTRSWERAAAAASLDAPARSLDYELRVDPRREGLWAVTRYRLRFADPREREAAGLDEDEKLQWGDGQRLRRFACRPQGTAGCRWRELEPDSAAYRAELGPVLLVWRLHRRLLHARARSLLPHP